MRLTNPASPRVEELCFLNQWVTELQDAQLRDHLLDLRSALIRLTLDPARAVRSFLRLRPHLCRSSYLSQHRVRRVLERHLAIEVSTPRSCTFHPLRLHWSSLALTLDHARRVEFEQGSADWAEIRVRLIAKRPVRHGQDPL